MANFGKAKLHIKKVCYLLTSLLMTAMIATPRLVFAEAGSVTLTPGASQNFKDNNAGDPKCPIYADLYNSDINELQYLYYGLCGADNVFNMSQHPTMGSADSPLGRYTNPVDSPDRLSNSSYTVESQQNSALVSGIYGLSGIDAIPTGATICSAKATLNYTPDVDSDPGNTGFLNWGNYPDLPHETDPNTTTPTDTISDYSGEGTGMDFGVLIYNGSTRVHGTVGGAGMAIPGIDATIAVGAYDAPAVGTSRSVTITPTDMPTRSELATWKLGLGLQQDSYGDINHAPSHWVWSEDNNRWEADEWNAPGPQTNKTDDVTINDLSLSVSYNTNSNCANQTTVTNTAAGTDLAIDTPEGTTLTCSSAVKYSDVATKDANKTYPLGLVNFCFSADQGSSNQVSLTFVTDLKPNQVTPRKYNSTTHTYADVPGATVAETTKDGKHALKLTYSIADGGPLDQDGEVNGAIVDPVGLATNPSLAGTGQNSAVFLLAAGGMMSLALVMLVLSLRRQSRAVK